MGNVISFEQLCGVDDSAVDRNTLRAPLHREVVPAFQALRQDAAEAGFELQIASGFRDYQRQLAIWNGKAEGRRPVLDADERQLQRDNLDDWQWVQAILRWSALPGASRHHWGSDLDVYDAGAVPADYQLRLERSEVEGDGPFAPFHDWLDERIAADRAHGFFRPYATDRGGVSPERWHLSYAPLAARCQCCLNEAGLFDFLRSRGDIALWPTVAEHWQAIYRRYISVPAQCYPAAFAGVVGGVQSEERV